MDSGNSLDKRGVHNTIEETGPSTDNDVRTTAVFIDPEKPASTSDAATYTNNGDGTSGNENCGGDLAASNHLNHSSNNLGNFAAHVQTESVLSSQNYDRSERFMSKDSAG